ncbi:MAG: HD domain-containing protein [Chloroflexi bacterium]|nr:HD domain-containing protein [Chloroflexota bacterium]
MLTSHPLLDAPPVSALTDTFAQAGRSLYLVGGPVRDLLLGRPLSDLDFTTDARPPQIKSLVRLAGADSIFTIGEKFGTIGGVFGEIVVEITTYRSEEYEPGSRKPRVEFGDSLDGDLSRRDFTINAMALDPRTGAIVDPFDGQTTLRARRIATVGKAEDRFSEDPLRLLRGVRLAAQLAFEIDRPTRRAIVAHAEMLGTISRERIAQEIDKILVSRLPGLGIRLLTDLGLMPYIIPEVLAMRGMTQDASYHHKDVYDHTIQVLDKTAPELTLRWAALLHDIAKPRTRSIDDGVVHFYGHEAVGAQMARRILADLRQDKHTIEHVAALVALHQRANAYEDDWTDGAVRRFIREAGDVLDDLLALSAADVTSRRPERQRTAAARVEALRARIAEIRAREEVEKLSSPLDGNELMALFGRGPGPWIKPVKDRLLAAVLDGALTAGDKAGAEVLARTVLAEVDGAPVSTPIVSRRRCESGGTAD